MDVLSGRLARVVASTARGAVKSDAGRPRPGARPRATLDGEHGVVHSHCQQAALLLCVLGRR